MLNCPAKNKVSIEYIIVEVIMVIIMFLPYSNVWRKSRMSETITVSMGDADLINALISNSNVKAVLLKHLRLDLKHFSSFVTAVSVTTSYLQRIYIF